MTSVWERGGGKVSYFNDCLDQSTERKTQLFSYFRSYRFRLSIKDHNCQRNKAQVLEMLVDLAQSIFLLSFNKMLLPSLVLLSPPKVYYKLCSSPGIKSIPHT